MNRTSPGSNRTAPFFPSTLLFRSLVDSRASWLVPVNTAGDLARLSGAGRTAPGRPVWALLRAHADPARNQPMPDPTTAGLLAFGALTTGASGLVWQGEDNYAARNAGMLGIAAAPPRSEEHTSELQSLMRISYAVFCLKKKTHIKQHNVH